MQKFSVWADWELNEPVTPELLARVDQTWPPNDETFCSGPHRDDSEVLSMTFEVEAPDFPTAVAAGRKGVERLASQLDLPGRLRPLTAYTETHHYTET